MAPHVREQDPALVRQEAAPMNDIDPSSPGQRISLELREYWWTLGRRPASHRVHHLGRRLHRYQAPGRHTGALAFDRARGRCNEDGSPRNGDVRYSVAHHPVSVRLAHALLTTRRHPRPLDDNGHHVEPVFVRGGATLGSGGREAVGVRVSPLAPRSAPLASASRPCAGPAHRSTIRM